MTDDDKVTFTFVERAPEAPAAEHIRSAEAPHLAAFVNNVYRRELDRMLEPSPLLAMLPPPTPLTRRQRARRFLRYWRGRIGDAWRVLRTGDIEP